MDNLSRRKALVYIIISAAAAVFIIGLMSDTSLHNSDSLQHLYFSSLLVWIIGYLCLWFRPKTDFPNAMILSAGFTFVVTTVREVAQIWQPDRTFDWWDLGWQVAGIAVAYVAAITFAND